MSDGTSLETIPAFFVVQDCNCGCVETPVKKPDGSAIPPIPKVERKNSTTLAQKQLSKCVQASFDCEKDV